MNPLFARQGVFIMILLLMMIFTGGFTIEKLAFGLPAVLIAITLHEFAHAFIADKLGDPTPRLQGRLSFDIRNHIDPVGILLFLFVGFGWAKPVETDPRNLKNPRKAMALIAAAGPIMNILIGIITIIIAVKLGSGIDVKILKLFQYIIGYNISFAVFNFIPIPPLDGSKIIALFMSPKTYYKYQEFEYRYQFQLMMGLMFVVFVFPGVLGKLINFFGGPIESVGITIANLLPF